MVNAEMLLLLFQTVVLFQLILTLVLQIYEMLKVSESWCFFFINFGSFHCVWTYFSNIYLQSVTKPLTTVYQQGRPHPTYEQSNTAELERKNILYI